MQQQLRRQLEQQQGEGAQQLRELHSAQQQMQCALTKALEGQADQRALAQAAQNRFKHTTMPLEETQCVSKQFNSLYTVNGENLLQRFDLDNNAGSMELGV